MEHSNLNIVRTYSTMILFACFISFPGFTQKNSAGSPLKNINVSKKNTNVDKYLNSKTWNDLFPNRYSVGSNKSLNPSVDFYSFKAFETAAKYFPAFIADGDEATQKRELSAFLANIAQETSGGWANAPGGYFKWGLYFLEEQNVKNTKAYSDSTSKAYPPVAGKQYYGRGPKQISWNYNYGLFSETWFGDKQTLLKNPELITQDGVLAFASAIWFWMTTQPPKPSCHDVMTGKWKPTDNDKKNNRKPGFGATLNIINGGIECGTGSTKEKTNYRYQYYQYFCTYFKVSPGDNISCETQAPFGR